MDLDILLHHYFGTASLEEADEGALVLGKERLAIDFGSEREPGRRFALWTLMDALGTAPVPAEAFAEAEDAPLRAAAEAYLTAAWRMERYGEGDE
ncbi:hypothetical protein GCM10007897_28070 [Sphingobium jiangsuense]|uniref:Uncharacterized protein n=1 Tax=Sphingobium jiangsuense TaxID=870476 RepID=A0A7W6BJJ1_9SPHN|nr:hypothetical protein [Sphingobium jiangsuense]MBB3926147.1 hypothetical protein [Sphingobium jiangsuense]GLT01413.1 hypothetical protein GCM10007897_28070 [Sphingobium jiangsuense]